MIVTVKLRPLPPQTVKSRVLVIDGQEFTFGRLQPEITVDVESRSKIELFDMDHRNVRSGPYPIEEIIEHIPKPAPKLPFKTEKKKDD